MNIVKRTLKVLNDGCFLLETWIWYATIIIIFIPATVVRRVVTGSWPDWLGD